MNRYVLTIALCMLAITSCRTVSEPTANEAPATTDITVATTPPFQTKEPERYSATRTLTTFTNNGDTVITKTFIARDGPMRREEQDGIVYLDLPAGRFVLLPDQKLYAAAGDEQPAALKEGDENSPDRLLHTDPISTTYQSLGPETVSGRNTSKYRIVVNSSRPENVSLNETLMWIDDALNMPIKSETKSPDGTRSVMELSGVTLDADKQLFQIPAGFEKIAFSALQKQLRAARLNPSLQ